MQVVARGRRPFAQALAVTVAICVVDLLLFGRSQFSAFVAGALAASTWWMFILALRQTTERQTKGVEAERRTAELLSGVQQWLAVNDVFVQGRNVDHVVITPLAVLAVETKWWGQVSPNALAGWRHAAIEQARRDSETVKRLLRSKGLGFDLPVRPVVLTWGPGAEAAQIDGVDVVDGENAASWIAAYQGGAIHPDLASQVHVALLAYQARNDAHRAKNKPPRAATAG